MKRYILFVVAFTLLLAAFTFYFFNMKVLLQPSPQIDFSESLAPLGATIGGISGIAFTGEDYLFYHAPDGSSPADTVYSISTTDPDVQKGLINIYEFISGTYPVRQGGTYYRNVEGAVLNPLQLSQQANVVFTHQLLPNDVVRLNYIETMQGVTTQKQFDIQISGKTMIIKAEAVNPSSNYLNNYAGFSFGSINGANSGRAVQVPYMKTATVSVINNNYFVSNYIDWTKSNSNDAPMQIYPNLNGNNFVNSFSSKYIPGQNNVYPDFAETAYITISENVHDTFLNIHRQKSPYRDDLNHRIVWHAQTISTPSAYFGNQGQGGRFVVNAQTMINQLAQWGVKDVFFGFRSSMGLRDSSVTFPETCPPSPWYGNQAGYEQLKNTAYANGYIFAPFHDDKADIFQQSVYWQEEYCDDITREPLPVSGISPVAIDSNGKCKLSGWYTPTQGNGQYFYHIAQDKLMNYAILQSQCMNSWVESNGHYIDVLAKIDLKELVDYSSINPNSRTISQGFRKNMEIYDFVHQTVDGPITAEGGEHNLIGIDTYLAGKVDAPNREIFGREDAPLIPDFELKVFKKLSVGQGVGSIDRWVRLPTGNFEWGQPIVFSDFVSQKSDKYRATTIAFGHTGFFDDVFMWNQGSTITVPEFYNYFVKEYYIFSKLQELYLSSDVVSIEYYLNNNFLDLSGTLKTFNSQNEQNNFFNDSQIKMTYENGLEVYVNRNHAIDWMVSVNGQTYYLPPNGWIASHASTGFLIYSALVDDNGNPSASGHRVDYVWTPDYIMVNGRGVQTNFGQDYFGGLITSTYMTVIKPNGWKLSENSSGGFSVTTMPISINQLNPNSFITSSNPPWITVSRAVGSIFLSQNFGIQIKESSNPNWPTNPPLYCFYGPFIGSGGDGICEYVDSNTVRFKTQNNPIVNSYDVRYVDLTDINNPLISTNYVPLTVTPQPFCGDNLCNGAETCSTCEIDCNACPPTVPPAPTSLTVTTIDSSSLKLDWLHNANNEDGFKIDYKLHSESTWSTINIPVPNTLTYTHTGLSANTEYDYRVYAYNNIGNSEFYPLTGFVSGTTGSVVQPPPPSNGPNNPRNERPRSNPISKPACSDGKDNDNDGLIDFPADPGCSSQIGNSEININQEQINSTEEKKSIEIENKKSQIRVFFLITIILLITGIILAIIKITIMLRIQGKKKITPVTFFSSKP